MDKSRNDEDGDLAGKALPRNPDGSTTVPADGVYILDFATGDVTLEHDVEVEKLVGGGYRVVGTTPPDTLGPDAALIGRLRNPGDSDEFDVAVLDDAADRIEFLRHALDLGKAQVAFRDDRIEALTARLERFDEIGAFAALKEELSNERIRHTQFGQEANRRIRTTEARLARAEECIQQVRALGGVPIDQAWQRWRESIAAYDAAKEASDG